MKTVRGVKQLNECANKMVTEFAEKSGKEGIEPATMVEIPLKLEKGDWEDDDAVLDLGELEVTYPDEN